MQVLLAYVNLLKTISMKLTPGLVELFFYPDDGAGEGASFPLYTEAVKFVSHRCWVLQSVVAAWLWDCWADGGIPHIADGAMLLDNAQPELGQAQPSAASMHSVPPDAAISVRALAARVRAAVRTLMLCPPELHLNPGINRYRAAPVRAAVRTLTLNLYALEAPGVQAFLAGPQAAPYFTDLGVYMTERCQVGCWPVARSHCSCIQPSAATQSGEVDMLFMSCHVLSCVQALDKALAALQGGSPSAAREVEGLLAEVEALLSYWNDILCTSESLDLCSTACAACSVFAAVRLPNSAVVVHTSPTGSDWQWSARGRGRASRTKNIKGLHS